MEWLRRKPARGATIGVTVAALALALAVLVIVGNTIRLDIYSRREEIEIAKLIGASDAFIRRPFLYSGTWYGLGGGLLAWALVATATGLLAGPIERVASLYASAFRLHGLTQDGILALVAGGALLGWVGSWITASYHLRRIEPRA